MIMIGTKVCETAPETPSLLNTMVRLSNLFSRLGPKSCSKGFKLPKQFFFVVKPTQPPTPFPPPQCKSSSTNFTLFLNQKGQPHWSQTFSVLVSPLLLPFCNMLNMLPSCGNRFGIGAFQRYGFYFMYNFQTNSCLYCPFLQKNSV